MDKREILIELEKDLDLSVFTIDDVWVYPIIRQNLNVFVFQGIKNDTESHSSLNLLNKFFQSFKWHFRNKPLQQNDILVVDGANSRKLTSEGKHELIYTNYLSKIYNSVLTIERPSDIHNNHIENITEKNIYYPDLQLLKTLFRSKISKSKYEFLNSKEFKMLKKHLKIEKNIETIITTKINRFREFVSFYERIIKRVEPKIIFSICAYSYSNMALNYAAKKFRIPTIELQHGLINKSHTGYIYKNVVSNDLFPEYLFTYGEYDTELLLNESKMFEPDKIRTVGFPYLDSLKKDRDELISKNKKTIYITSQWTLRNELKLFVEKLSLILPTHYKIIFKTHPRETDSISFYDSFNKLKNVDLITDPNRNSLEIMNDVNIHSTVYSTSFMESIYFDLPNIFIEMEGYSDSIKKFIDNKTCYLVKTPEEYVKILKIIEDQADIISTELKLLSKKFYSPNPLLNIQKEIKKIINA